MFLNGKVSYLNYNSNKHCKNLKYRRKLKSHDWNSQKKYYKIFNHLSYHFRNVLPGYGSYIYLMKLCLILFFYINDAYNRITLLFLAKINHNKGFKKSKIAQPGYENYIFILVTMFVKLKIDFEPLNIIVYLTYFSHVTLDFLCYTPFLYTVSCSALSCWFIITQIFMNMKSTMYLKTIFF